MNLNKVMLAGNLTRDVELRHTQGGKAIGKFGLAVNERWKTPEGEKREKTTYVDCVVWGALAEVMAEHLSKGRPVFIEGRLEYSSWTDNDTGKKRNKLEVTVDTFQFLGAKPEGDDGKRSQSRERTPKGEDYGDVPF